MFLSSWIISDWYIYDINILAYDSKVSQREIPSISKQKKQNGITATVNPKGHRERRQREDKTVGQIQNQEQTDALKLAHVSKHQRPKHSIERQRY